MLVIALAEPPTQEETKCQYAGTRTPHFLSSTEAGANLITERLDGIQGGGGIMDEMSGRRERGKERERQRDIQRDRERDIQRESKR